ncbi:MAG TPA: c-type cytochrome [Verrucomicrobiae bacterium]|jgi:mono/diheme cytochrome c family protein
MKINIILPALFGLASALFAAETNNPAAKPSAADPQIQRGQYLVENVAMCADCHTPRDDKGQFDRTQWLKGNVLDIKPDHPMPSMPFAAVAVPIAGLPGFTDEKAVRFLETGIDVAGKPAMWPMPQFRFNHDDAVAVAAYLRSLKP